jgi:diaminopimelate decarboxylase
MSKIPPNQHIPNKLQLSAQILTEAAEKFGTPLYVYDAAMLKHQWQSLHSIFSDSITIYYSVKANPNPSLIRIFEELGASFEVVSIGELATVIHADVSPSHIIFVGPGKTHNDLKKAINQDIQAIVAESPREVEEIQQLSKNVGKKTHVALRINPGRGKGMITMGGVTQFGMEKEVALNMLLNTSKYPNLEIIGIHVYLGTGILDWRIILQHTEMILQVADELQQQTGKEFSFVDIGGGFGIPYYEGDQALDLIGLHIHLNEIIKKYLVKYPQTKTFAMESGRFLVGSSGAFVTRVIDVKKSSGKWFIILDGGTNVFGGDNRYRGFRLTPVQVLNYENQKTESLNLCGPLCTSADQLAVDTLLPKPHIGDFIAFYQAGAYGLTASPGFFLSHGFPREVIYRDNKLSLIRERITI